MSASIPLEVVKLLPAVEPQAVAQEVSKLDPAVGLRKDLLWLESALCQQRSFGRPICGT